MHFKVKRDLLLKSLTLVQGVVEKKYFTNTFKRFTSVKKQ